MLSSIAETKDHLRMIFEQCGVNINLASDPFRHNAVIDVGRISKFLEDEFNVKFCLSEISQFDKVLLLCNSIGKLPEWVKELKNINGFILIGTLTNEFMNEITCFKHIQELLLLNTEIRALPASIGDSTELRNLYICDSQIASRKFPDTIGKLEKLRTLVAFGTTITELPDSIGDLEALKVLDISGTAIDALPDSVGKLRNLQTLVISDTLIQRIPDSVSDLDQLDHFYLYGLTIDKMPWFRNCTQGVKVFCNGFDNYIPFSIRHQPAGLFNQPSEIIQQYYDAEKKEINNFKVIFLGYGAAGKTHTSKRMMNHGKLQDYDTQQTDGLDIFEETFFYEGEELVLSFWDFGGQDRMYSMHRCFLTERTCYVVVVSNRLHENLQDQAEYWLRNINIFAKKSSVVIAVNNSEKTYSEGVNTEQLRKQFPEILIGDSVSYSAKCSPENEFNRLTNAVLRQIHHLDSYKMEFPKNWVRILNEIKGNQNDYLSKKQYWKICENNGVNSPDIRKWLLSWFHDLGYCFCNHIDLETGYELEDYQVINPNWISTAMYRINQAHDALNGGRSYVNEIDFEKGTIGQNTLYFLINDNTLGGQSKQTYELNEIEYILEVMRKFKLSYRISSAREFIPVLCKYEKSSDLAGNEFAGAIVYYIKYVYLPETVIHRLMIYLYQNGRGHNLSAVWRHGFCLDIKDLNFIAPKDTLRIIVEMDRGNDMLRMKIWGKTAKDQWKWLRSMLEFITQINLSTNCHVVEEYVEKKKGQQIAHLPLSSILKAKEKGHSVIWSTDGGEYESYSLEELIGETFGSYDAVTESRARQNSVVCPRIGNLGNEGRHGVNILLMVSTEAEEKAITNNENFELRELDNKITYFFKSERGLDIALARGFEYGELDAAIMTQTLYMTLNPKVIAMAGFCAGKRGTHTLGDVVVAEKVFNYDQGKQISKSQIQPQISSYKLDVRIKQKIERYSNDWRSSITINPPKDFELQCFEFLQELSKYPSGVNPKELYSKSKYPNWIDIVQIFLRDHYISQINNGKQISLSSKGTRYLNDLILRFPGGFVSQSPSAMLGVLATGTKVQQWDGIFNYLNSKYERKCSVLDMEGHAMGKIAEFNKCPFIIAKGVGDFAQNGKAFDNRFINYAVYSSYKFLVEFLCDNYAFILNIEG